MNNNNSPDQDSMSTDRLEGTGVITLTNVVTKGVEDIIDLTDVAADEIDDYAGLPGGLLRGNEELDDAVGMDMDSGNNFTYSLGIELKSDAEDMALNQDTGIYSDSSLPENIQSVSITDKQIREALESVTKKIYSEKIEVLLVDIVEKLVTKEIKRTREMLIKNVEAD